MNLKNIMLTERRQSQKATYYVIPLIWNLQNRKSSWRQKVDQWFPEARKRENPGVTINGYGVFIWDAENNLELDSSDGSTTL